MKFISGFIDKCSEPKILFATNVMTYTNHVLIIIIRPHTFSLII